MRRSSRGRPHHQQRLDLGACAAARLHRLHRHQARHHGLTKAAALDGRPFDIAVGQIDIGNAASDMTARMAEGVPQADGSVRPEPRMDLQAVADTFMAMVRLPLSANVLFTTVMATRCPTWAAADRDTSSDEAAQTRPARP
jgi:hypothetical protein